MVEEESEQLKIKQAITTDFILSIEIVMLALGTVALEPLMTRIIVTSFIAILATVGVYGLVALLVRMDDFGAHLVLKADLRKSTLLKTVGHWLIAALPKIIKALTVIGVLAMLLVAGGIFTHNLAFLHEIALLNTLLGELFLGLIAGFIVIGLFKMLAYLKTGAK